MTTRKRLIITGASGALALGVAACGGDNGGGGGGGDLSGTITIDGSSTVAPLSEAAAELFQGEHPNVRVTVGTSGTGGGFEKFCAGETDIADASREIRDEEKQACEQRGVEWEELTVANDGIAVIANPENPVDCVTVDQLGQVWDTGSDVSSWGGIEGLQPSFDEELQLFGPGTDSGTFDFFTEAINGEEGRQRSDYNNVGEDDNATVTGVSGSKGGMGYLGLSFVQENEGRVKALQVDDEQGGEGCVPPTEETVQDGTYEPLGRRLFIYPSAQALQRPEVQEFARFYIERAEEIAQQALFVPLTQEQKDDALSKVEALTGGGAGAGTEPTG